MSCILHGHVLIEQSSCSPHQLNLRTQNPRTLVYLVLPIRKEPIHVIINQNDVSGFSRRTLDHHNLNLLQVLKRPIKSRPNLLRRHLSRLRCVRKLLDRDVVLISQSPIPLDVNRALLRDSLGAFNGVDRADEVETQLVESAGGGSDAPAGVGAGESGLLEAGDDAVGVGVDLDYGGLAGDAGLFGCEAGVVEAAVGFEVVVRSGHGWDDGEVVVLLGTEGQSCLGEA